MPDLADSPLQLPWCDLGVCAHVCGELRFYSQVNVGTSWNKMQTFNIRQTSRDICLFVLIIGCTRFPLVAVI